VQEVAEKLLAARVSAVPVVDANGHLLGIVSEGDLMRRTETGTDAAPRSWWLRMFRSGESGARDYIKTHGASAGDVMSSPAVTVGPDEDIARVALLLEKKRIKRVPVAANGELLGIVSRADLLRGLATHGPLAAEPPADDRAIRDALVKHLDEQPWARSALVNITVHDGVVNLWGVFDSTEQHEALLVAARNTAGVRGVEDHLSLDPPY
jgi:CBS domain-containing protein